MTRKEASLTEPLFFDTDCLAAFLWVGDQSILATLYPNRIVIPGDVYNELSRPGTQEIKTRIDTMISNGQAEVQNIEIGSKEYNIYRKLAYYPDEGHCIIGHGEAAAISLAKERNGILASNNLRDISQYVKEYSLKHVTTGDILFEAFKKGIITEDDGNTIWANMLAKNRKIGASSFSEFIKSKL